MATNVDWFNKHGVFLEKYNVVQPDKPPVKGVYPSLTGFGWTNAVFLKLLAGKDLYLTEIAQQLDLSKPTIKHHLALLRAAGLVTIVEAGTVIYYTLRRDRIESASADLAGFLVP